MICSSYGPEGIGTTCSVQWHQRTASSRSYIICLFIFCLLLPLLVMIFCYGKILLVLRAVSLRVSAWRTRSSPFAEGGTSDVCTFYDLQVGGASGERRETRVLKMVVCMVAGYLLCWMPYGAVAMLASFGPPAVVPPTASLIPSLLAKTSTVLNPVIYVRLNHQVVIVIFFALINVTTVHLPNVETPLSSAGASCTWSVGAPRPLLPRSCRQFQPAKGCGYKFPACQAWSKILPLPRSKHSRAAQTRAALYATSISIVPEYSNLLLCWGVCKNTIHIYLQLRLYFLPVGVTALVVLHYHLF